MSQLKRASSRPANHPRALTDSRTAWWRSPICAGAAVIVAATVVAYFPAIHGEFLHDDEKLLVGSRFVHASDGLYQFWFTTNAMDYWPLTNTSFWLEWRLWGAHPAGYHVTNLLLHLTATFLIWAILRKLAIAGAFLAALLFAVHPVNVESVAWISQRKNTLAMVFFLLSILWYLRAEETQETRDEGRGLLKWYWLSLAAFGLAMLSKGSVAMLPVVLLLIAWWQRRRMSASDVIRTAPFFLVAIVLTGVNIWFQKHGQDVVVRDVSFPQRLAGAGAVVWFYLAKALAPIDLVFVYPRWQIEAGALLWWLPLAAALGVSVVLARQLPSPTINWRRALLFAWLFFCVALVPVLGFTDVGFMQYSLVADHYQHIAIIAVAAVVAAAWTVWHRTAQGALRWVAALAGGTLVAGLTFLTWQQSRLYGNAIDLYQDTVANNPDCWMAYHNLGTSLLHAGRTQEAMPHIEKALRLKPESAAAHFNLGCALESAGRLPEAIEEFQSAVQLRTDFSEAHVNLGNALRQLGRTPEAILQYRQALRLRSDIPLAQNNLGNALLWSGQVQEALEHLQEAVRLDPQLPEAHNNLGLALTKTGRLPEGVPQFQQAIKLKPDYAEAYGNLGLALAAVGRLPEAIEQDQRALELDAKLPDVHYNLANALVRSGRLNEAIDHYQQAVKIDADNADVWNDLGNALLRSRRFAEAMDAYRQTLRIKPDYVGGFNGMGAALLAAGRPQEAADQYLQALRLTPDDATISNNLAAAYAELKRPSDAIAAAERGIELARAGANGTG